MHPKNTAAQIQRKTPLLVSLWVAFLTGAPSLYSFLSVACDHTHQTIVAPTTTRSLPTRRIQLRIIMHTIMKLYGLLMQPCWQEASLP